MTPQRPLWTAVLSTLVAWTAPAVASDPLGPVLPPPGAVPELPAPPPGYHQQHYGGFGQGTLPSIWADLDYVYRRQMHDVFTYKPWKWRYGYPVGYGIDAAGAAGGPFGNTERCGLTPLHYRAEAPTVFAGPKPGLPGAAWYRLEPVPAAPVPSSVLPVSPGPVPAPSLTQPPRAGEPQPAGRR